MMTVRQPPARAWRFATVGVILLAAVFLFSAQGQWGGRRGRFNRSYEILDPGRLREQNQMEKALNPAFGEDVFTFARLKFVAERGYGYGGARLWDDDTPEADLNLIYRLFETTSLKVRPWLHFIDITTNELANYPFVYLASAGRLVLQDDQVQTLRRYLLNGGFMMADDFWGDEQWSHFYEQIKRVFPEREPAELTLEHPIFHTVFNFLKQPQIPSVGPFLRWGESFDPAPYYRRGHEPHYYALYDDKQRMMALICHNNHYGDGWEHETDDEEYFDKFSEPMAYPMLINILMYVMSH